MLFIPQPFTFGDLDIACRSLRQHLQQVNTPAPHPLHPRTPSHLHNPVPSVNLNLDHEDRELLGYVIVPAD